MPGFKRKKITAKQTVGQRLKQARLKKKIALEQVEEATKVRLKYLKAIEADDWKKLPSAVYSLGFVCRYVDFLGVKSRKIVDDYKAETGMKQNEVFSAVKKKKDPFGFFVITPKLIIGILILLIIVSLVVYIFIAVSKFSAPPQIEIDSPQNEQSFTTNKILVEGNTLDTAIVLINNQIIPVDSSGRFSQELVLVPGVNFIEIKSRSRAGKESSKTVKVLLKTDNTSATITPENQ